MIEKIKINFKICFTGFLINEPVCNIQKSVEGLATWFECQKPRFENLSDFQIIPIDTEAQNLVEIELVDNKKNSLFSNHNHSTFRSSFKTSSHAFDPSSQKHSKKFQESSHFDLNYFPQQTTVSPIFFYSLSLAPSSKNFSSMFEIKKKYIMKFNQTLFSLLNFYQQPNVLTSKINILKTSFTSKENDKVSFGSYSL